ncbi:unnamed protein product [Merluccius merluccius]
MEKMKRGQEMLEGPKGRDVGEEGVEVQTLPILLIPQNLHQHCFPQQNAQSGSHPGAAALVLVCSQKDEKSVGTVGSQKCGWNCFHSSYWIWSGSFGTRKAVVGGGAQAQPGKKRSRRLCLLLLLLELMLVQLNLLLMLQLSV